MIVMRAAAERGKSDFGWLDSRHTFSFGDYHDPDHMGFRTLRVINDDRVVPGAGFPTHPHRDMEILTYVLEGAIAHRDSMGNGTVIRAGELQRMSAGTGVTHSEFNASPTERLHFLQIWVLPERRGLPPTYEQRAFPPAGREGKLTTVAAPGGEAGAITVHQDLRLHLALLRPGDRLRHPLGKGRYGWVHVARGALELNGQPLVEGDGAALSEEPALELTSQRGGEALVFDLA